MEEARANAESAFECCQDEASDGWPDCTEYVCYGTLNGGVIEVGRRRRNDSDNETNLHPDVQVIVEYELCDFGDPSEACS